DPGPRLERAADRDGARRGGAARPPQCPLRGRQRHRVPRRAALRRGGHARHRPPHPPPPPAAPAPPAGPSAARGRAPDHQGRGHAPGVEAVVHPRPRPGDGSRDPRPLLGRRGTPEPAGRDRIHRLSPPDGGHPAVPSHPLYLRAAALTPRVKRLYLGRQTEYIPEGLLQETNRKAMGIVRPGAIASTLIAAVLIGI